MEIKRRKLLKDLVILGIISSACPISTAIASDNGKEDFRETFDTIELFRYDIDIPRYFSWGTWYNRQHLFLLGK